MKKVVRMLGLCALVALAFTSCKKNETNGNVTFKATISQLKTDSRTHLETINSFGWKGLYWNSDDEILLFDRTKSEGNSETFTVKTFENKEASFEGDASFLANLYTENNYIAFYPNATETPEGIKIEIPANQNWGNATFEDDVYPMYGFNDENGHIQFHSHAGILYLNFKLNPTEYPGDNVTIPLTSIKVRGKNANDVLSGTMVYQLDGTYMMDPATTENYVELNCSGVSLSNQARMEFIIVLPEGALANGFYVDVTSVNATKTLEAQPTLIQGETMTWMGQLDLPAGL